MTAPRFAAHILAHDAPRQFADLVASLRHPQIDIYAHIDAKVDQRPFERALAPTDVVDFVPDSARVKVHWGGLSVLLAALASVDHAIASGIGHHRHSLLSGRDVALRPVTELVASWSENVDHLRVDRVLTEDDSAQAERIKRYHFPDHPALARLSGRIPRRRPIARDLVHGSAWWSLTAETVELIRAELTRDPGWLSDFRFVLVPDEIVVQSIVMASPRGARITQNNLVEAEPDRTLYAQHYIDWSDHNATSPPELSIDQVRLARATPAMFARKVGTGWTWRGGALPGAQAGDAAALPHSPGQS